MILQKADVEILSTNDGSTTLKSNTLGITYHSKHGAVQESQTVFIDAGLGFFCKHHPANPTINILEIGFGTGLNALLSFDYAQQHQTNIAYTAYEAYPVDLSTILQLNFKFSSAQATVFQQIHQANWNEGEKINSLFEIKKVNDYFENISCKNTFDIIYYDAFAPNAQPALWNAEMMSKMYAALKSNGVLVTYCAKGEFKRTLKSVGFKVEALPGPIGKREMTRAIKV